MIRGAREREAAQAKKLAKHFAAALRTNAPMSAQIREFYADALEAAAASPASAGAALGLIGQQARPIEDNLSRDLEVAEYLRSLKEINVPLESAVFDLDVPPDATPLTLEELRRAGPWGGGTE